MTYTKLQNVAFSLTAALVFARMFVGAAIGLVTNFA